ncbi:MAG: hypothetical protein KY475_08425 [Planctomycetes bacterium]|nr:hypothetical protein [Planctomycetota bacterium]
MNTSTNRRRCRTLRGIESLETRSLLAGIPFNFMLDDPQGDFEPFPALQGTLEAAGRLLTSRLAGEGSLEVRVVPNNTIPYARALAATFSTVTMAPTRHVVESGTIAEARSGDDPNGDEPDILVEINTETFLPEVFFDPSGDANVPSGKDDFLSAALHELVHTLGFSGYRAISGDDYGEFFIEFPEEGMKLRSTFDELTQFDFFFNPTLYFTGANAMSDYGDDVPLTTLGPDDASGENFYNLGNPEGRPGDDLLSDLMNGIVFQPGVRYELSELDLAMLADLGWTIRELPSFVKGPDQQVSEDAGAQTVPGWATDIAPGEWSFVVLSNSNPALFSQPPEISPEGVLTYSPADDQFGQATIGVHLTDGVTSSAEQSFTIDVLPVNDAPSFTPGADVTVEGADVEQIHSFPDWATNVSVGPANEQADQSPTFEIAGNSNPALFSQPPAIDANGQLTFASAAGETGDAEITVVLRDNGGTDPGEGASPAAMFNITVLPAMADDPLDVDASGMVTLNDLLEIVAHMRSVGTASPAPATGPPFPDVTRDGMVTFADLLAVVQHIRAQLETTAGEGEPHDAVFAERSNWAPPPAIPDVLEPTFDDEEEGDQL